MEAKAKIGRSTIKTWGKLERYTDKKHLPKGYTHYPILGKRGIWEILNQKSEARKKWSYA